MNICIVYLGNILPNYVIRNIEYLNGIFANHNIWLVSDVSVNCQMAKQIGIKTWRCSPPHANWQILNETGLDENYRDGFYTHALARFYAIHEFMESNYIDGLVQIEADVLVAPNFPFDKFENITEEVAFPFERHEVAIPSIVYFKNTTSINNLIDFLNKSLKKNVVPIDMFLLAKYQDQFPHRVNILPTAIMESSLFNDFVTPETRRKLGSNVEKYGGVFDSSTWGQHLFGFDRRNFLGFQILNYVQKNHAVNPSRARIQFDRNGNIRLIADEKTYFLFNLHIHSKNSAIFTDLRQVTLKSSYSNFPRKIKISFSPSVFISEFDFRVLLTITKLLIRKFKKF